MTGRSAAVVSWAYAAGFGIPAVPVAIHLRRTGSLPTFFDLFPMYGGPWFERLSREQFTALLVAFLLVEAAVAGSALPLWRGRRSGAVANLALLPVEAVFWLGFALPIPWVVGAARVALIAAGWSSRARR